MALIPYAPPPSRLELHRPRFTPLPGRRLHAAKAAYTTRHVELDVATRLMTGVPPNVGDLVLARVTELGQHNRIELAHGRRAAMFVGDEIVVAYGNRYAPDQFEASVPSDLGPCELVAAGGIAARVLSAHGKMAPATSLEPVGLLASAGGDRLNLRRGVVGEPVAAPTRDRPLTIAVVGASMNSGKTTTAAYLVRGLRLAGLRVGAAKATGTGAGGDVWLLSDAGAFPVYDFTNAGWPSTYLVSQEDVRDIFVTLTDRLAEDGCEIVVIEVADGVFQQETSALLVDPVFAERVDAVIFASYDALGATAGVHWLRNRGLAPIAVSGVVSSSPLATREAEAAANSPVWDLRQLSDPLAARRLYGDLLVGVVPGSSNHPHPAEEATTLSRQRLPGSAASAVARPAGAA